MRSRWKGGAALAVLTLAVVGCAGKPDSLSVQPTDATAETTSVGATADSRTPHSDGSSKGTDSLRWGLQGFGTVNWGSTEDEARSRLASVLGTPSFRIDSECSPPRSVLAWPGLALQFIPGRGLVGYEIDSDRFASEWGFGIGSSIHDTQAAQGNVKTEQLESKSGFVWSLGESGDRAPAPFIYGPISGQASSDLLESPVVGTAADVPTPLCSAH